MKPHNRYLELQREFGSIIALRDGLRTKTIIYQGMAEFDQSIGVEYRDALDQIEKQALKACQLLQNRLEEIEEKLFKL